MGVVPGGLPRDKSMVSFAGVFRGEEARAILAYVKERANELAEMTAA